MLNKILFFGNERLATGVTTQTPSLLALLQAGYEVAAVVIAQAESGASRKPRDLEIVQVAQANNVPVLTPEKLTEARRDLAAYGAEAAVLVAYGQLVPASIIEIFPRGIINIHPSLLPKHRGSTPIESVILHGETETGVSLMQLTGKMDAGPLYAQEKVKLTGQETKQALADALSIIGVHLLVQHLPAILDGSAKPTPQNEKQATVDERIEKSASQMDWEKPAVELEREVRAYYGWPRSRAVLGTSEVIVTQAHVAKGSGTAGMLWLENKQLGMYCSEDILVIDRLIPAGRKEMTAPEFLAGYRPS